MLVSLSGGPQGTREAVGKARDLFPVPEGDKGVFDDVSDRYFVPCAWIHSRHSGMCEPSTELALGDLTLDPSCFLHLTCLYARTPTTQVFGQFHTSLWPISHGRI